MAVYHIVLFRLKAGVTESQRADLCATAKAMVGQVPGLVSLEINKPLAMTRTKGYDFGIVAVLEKPEHVEVYAAHPAHLKVHAMREALCDDTLAFDMEF